MKQVQNVNAHSIIDAITLGCRTMERVFNADDNGTPFFLTYARPDPHLAYDGMFAEAHVPGRHLKALLRAESVAGVTIDEAAVEKHSEVLFRTLDQSVALPLTRWEIGSKPNHFVSHNLRETFHGLYALAAYRDSGRAVEAADRVIAAINDYWQRGTGWDVSRLESEHGVDFQFDHDGVVWDLGRAVDALVLLYQTTGLESARELAKTSVEAAMDETFVEDGTFAVERAVSHMHSVTSALTGLAAYAEFTGDDEIMNRAWTFYKSGLWRMRDEIGWCVEGLRSNGGGCPDMGEGNNTGDILEAALTLGRWGRVEAYHDAERILRAHLLPSQLRDTSWIEVPENPDGADGLRDVPARILGAWGFPAPYGHAPVSVERVMFHMDVVGGVVASLCNAFENVIRREGELRRVELLFDHEAHELRVTSPYAFNGTLKIVATAPGPIAVRIPEWAAPESIVVRGAEGRIEDGYLRIDGPPVNTDIEIVIPLVDYSITLHHRTHDIRVAMHGDVVTAMDSFGTDLTFFPPWE